MQAKKSRLFLAVCAALAATGAQAQQEPQTLLERVEVTGSSIKRLADQGALPVQVISRLDIERSGAKSAEDLIQALPSMQGFTVAAESVNGSGGGVQNASLHSLGARYTLVLLNGRRLAAYNAGSAVNLASIPLAAVERVEVLTDGASALYGSDAVAGVVNFILRRGQTDWVLNLSHNQPEQKGGASSSFSLSKGFGDLDKDRFSLLMTYAHDEQKELNAADRPFGASGIREFTHGGQRYALYQLAVNTTPASVTLGLKNPIVKDGEPYSAVTFSPNYLKNGQCAPNTALTTVGPDKACYFDFAATVQLIPDSTRDSFFSAGQFKLDKNTTLFGEVVLSQFDQRARYAPAAQGIALSLADPLYKEYVLPHLATMGVDPANVSRATTNNRFVDAGGRANLYQTRAQHLAFGIEGQWRDFDYSASLVHSTSQQDNDYDGGYMSRNCYAGLVSAGKVNPFAAAGGNAALFAPCVLHERATRTETALDVLSLRGSGELFSLPAGGAQLGVGVDLARQQYDSLPSPINQGPNKIGGANDTVFGSSPGALPVGASRNNWGAFGELLMPLYKGVDLTAAVRWDDYAKARNRYLFKSDGTLDAPGSQGNANSKSTYKLALRVAPTREWLLRGSLGSGFKAPNLDEITQPLQDFGVTSGKYPCPVKAPDPRAVDCRGTTQYDLLTGGNPLSGALGLKPEESQNRTIGFRLEPTRNLSFGMDAWWVKMKNQIVALPETFPFKNPAGYDGLFRTVFDAGLGANKLATLLPNFNLGRSRYSGIDWELSSSSDLGIGKLKIEWNGTYMLRSEVEIGGEVESSVGRFDGYNNVTARIVQRLAATLKQDALFSHTLAWNWRSGYHDAVQTAEDGSIKVVNADGTLGDYATVVRDVAAFSTLDWQTRLDWNKHLSLTLGAKNLLDRDPPLSIRTSGGGNQAGFDPRYASPLGRQWYVTATVRY
ncbi:TonB-dependent receptor domain-containing protein [Inhella proteolytica]|uniref:TonB-dependent receptor n=1 Tax=Inhella proteolytica TaxID=2795029 RepID=A0A931J6I9_9BURK|nr:TonB-dependent receptor [Inhella proteolytica]MBH9577050.1 TonB-dependent receptor [Inhella proteolytica]